MSESTPAPATIKLHRASRVLELGFDDGARFSLPCEYLRVFSPSAEVKVLRQQGRVITGNEAVNITQITPVGGYALRPHFDDGHDSGVYSWRTLYELGRDYEANWREYLAQRAAAGVSGDEDRKVRVLYFVSLPGRLGRESEELELPVDVGTVESLVGLLRRRGGEWDRALGETQLKVAVNKQFAVPATPVEPGDEFAIVPVESLGADGA
jgi:DUF971 family protein/molybdopterin converting factor small subunit